MDKRVVITMLAMMGFFMAVSYIYPLIFPSPPARTAATNASEQRGPSLLTAAGQGPVAPLETGAQAPSLPEGAEAAPPALPVAPPRMVSVDTPEYRAVFSESGARLIHFELKNYLAYRPTPDDPPRPQELVNPPADSGEFPLNFLFYNNQNEIEDLKDLRFAADADSVNVGAGGVGTLSFSATTPAGLTIVKVLTFRAGTYAIGQVARLENGGSVSYEGQLGLGLSSWPYGAQQNRYNAMTGYVNNSFISETVDDAQSELASLAVVTRAGYLGYMDQYFLSAFLFPDAGEATAEWQEIGKVRLRGRELKGQGVALSVFWPLNLPPGASRSYSFDVYYGPKDMDILREAGHDLVRSVDLGWFSFLGRPLGWLLRFFYGFVGNYGVAIILVTVLIKILLWPLTAKSYKSMKNMQKLSPKVQKIREKFKDAPQEMNKEMMALYKAEKVSPMGGCLPMLLQIPFFIAFYRVLDYALELRGAPFMLWIHDLSAPDRLFHFDVSVPLLSPPTGIPVLTLIMGATMLWQQRMTPAMGDPLQAKMMMLLPLVFIFFLLNMPSGLVLYWLVNNILSIFQQKLINRAGGPPAPPRAKAARAS
ncbi:MAG: membrane protein insertase YidC [Deltaproteobacteria bacterium]|jgi:YidC/Oxa1 family membrane protein insertase|nr:membrane protein insertase YidC [Deltaproteobacteria bacterium]